MPKLPINTEVETESNSTPTLTELFNDISTAINNKTGKSEVISAIDFADEINNIKVLNGIDEIINSETPVAYFDYNAGEPKQLDSENSGEYLISISDGYGVTKTTYAGQLEAGAPYVYKGDSLNELDYGVYQVYNSSGTSIKPASEISLERGDYYQVSADDTVYYTDNNPLTTIDTNTYYGLYYTDGAKVIGDSSMEEVDVNDGGYYQYNGNGDFTSVNVGSISSGTYYFSSGIQTVDGSSASSLNEGLYYISDSSSPDSVNLYNGYTYQYNGNGSFDELSCFELYYIDNAGSPWQIDEIYSGCAYIYGGGDSFTPLNSNALYRTYDHSDHSSTVAQEVTLPSDVDNPTYVTIDNVQYKISLVSNS